MAKYDSSTYDFQMFVDREQIIAQRQVLFSQIDVHLQRAGRYGTSLRKNTTIKHMLGILTKS